MEQQPGRVVVTDIDIKFGSMVFLLIKLSLALIPAGIILTVFGAIAAVLVGSISEKSNAAPSHIPSPCENYFNFINDVTSERLGGYPPDMYTSHPAQRFRDAAAFVYAHSYREIEDWKWEQLERCDRGEFDPYESSTN